MRQFEVEKQKWPKANREAIVSLWIQYRKCITNIELFRGVHQSENEAMCTIQVTCNWDMIEVDAWGEQY